MSETPAWLSDNNGNAGGGGDGNFEMTEGVNVTQPATPTGSATASGTASPSNAQVGSAEDAEKLPGVILTMRLANMGVAIALCTVSVSNKKGGIV